jgi:phosphate-selective porin OprO and OprP
MSIGATKYVKGHRVKLQSDLTYEQTKWLAGPAADANRFMFRFQIEVGI